MKVTAVCDICGTTLLAGDSYSSYEMDLCREHYLKLTLKDATSQRDNLRQWLEKTHLKRLSDLDALVRDLQAKLDELH